MTHFQCQCLVVTVVEATAVEVMVVMEEVAVVIMVVRYMKVIIMAVTEKRITAVMVEVYIMDIQGVTFTEVMEKQIIAVTT